MDAQPDRRQRGSAKLPAVKRQQEQLVDGIKSTCSSPHNADFIGIFAKVLSFFPEDAARFLAEQIAVNAKESQPCIWYIHKNKDLFAAGFKQSIEIICELQKLKAGCIKANDGESTSFRTDNFEQIIRFWKDRSSSESKLVNKAFKELGVDKKDIKFLKEVLAAQVAAEIYSKAARFIRKTFREGPILTTESINASLAAAKIDRSLLAAGVSINSYSQLSDAVFYIGQRIIDEALARNPNRAQAEATL